MYYVAVIIHAIQTSEIIANKKTQNSDREEAYKVKKRTVDLLPDAENNIAKLQVIHETLRVKECTDCWHA